MIKTETPHSGEVVACESCGKKILDDKDGREEMQIHEAECDGINNPRERFDVGDDVQYSDFGRKRLNEDHREGEIDRVCDDNRCVRVTWDDGATPQILYHHFVKHVEDAKTYKFEEGEEYDLAELRESDDVEVDYWGRDGQPLVVLAGDHEAYVGYKTVEVREVNEYNE